MAAEPEHSKLIAKSAKGALSPLGFRRKGRSRLWIADHGCWLGFVEFQASAFELGSYLNVGVHFLWTPVDFLSFDHSVGDRPWIDFETSEQFAVAADALAFTAAALSAGLIDRFPNLEQMAQSLVDEQLAQALAELPQAAGRWRQYHVGVAAGIVGRTSDAERLLEAFASRASREAIANEVDALRDHLTSRAAFRSAVERLIARQRDILEAEIP